MNASSLPAAALAPLDQPAAPPFRMFVAMRPFRADWKVKCGGEVIHEGTEDTLEGVRGMQLTLQIEDHNVVIDTKEHAQEVAEAAYTYGWRVTKAVFDDSVSEEAQEAAVLLDAGGETLRHVMEVAAEVAAQLREACAKLDVVSAAVAHDPVAPAN